MKRKFTSLLLLAFTVVSVGFLASCKDYDEDNYNQLKLENATLSEYYKDLSAKYTDLANQLNAINSCTCDPTLQQKIQNIINQIGSSDTSGDLGTFIVKVINEYEKQNPGLTSTDVTNIVNEILNQKGYSTLTTTQVEEMIKKALEGISKCNCGYSEDIVNSLIKAYIAKEYGVLHNLGESDVQKLIKEYLASQNYATKDDLNNLNNLSKDDVINIVKGLGYVTQDDLDKLNNLSKEDIIKILTEGGYLTASQINEAIENYIKNNVTTVTQETVNQWIADYIKNNPDSASTQVIQNVINNFINNQTAIQQIADAAANLLANNYATKEYVDNNYATKEYVDNSVGAVNDKVDNFINNVYTVAIDKLNSGLTQAQADATAALKLAKEDSVRIDGIVSDIASIKTDIEGINSKLSTAETNITNLQTQYKEASDKIDALAKVDSSLQAQIDDLKSQIGKGGSGSSCNCNLDSLHNVISTEVASLYATKSELSTSIANLKTELTTLISQREKYLQDQISALYTNSQVDAKLTELQQAYKDADSNLQNQINTLTTNYNALSDKVEKLSTKVNDLTADVNTLNEKVNALASQVTGIIIQQVYNSAIGTLNASSGINTNILVAYYGSKATNLTLTGEEWHGEWLPDDGATVIGGTGNAGKMYLTVNPNTVDFTGLQFSLVNSLDEESPIKLGKAQRSYDVLSIGYTRADNGFYEVPATLNAKDVENSSLHLNIDKTALKEALTDLVHTKSKAAAKLTMQDMASVAYTTLEGLKLDAQGVQCKWSDSFGEHKVYSQYNTAAVAVEALGFDTEASVKEKLGIPRTYVPGYQRALNLIDKVCNKIADKLVEEVNSQFRLDDIKYDINDVRMRLDSIDYVTNDKKEVIVYYTYEKPTSIDKATGNITGYETVKSSTTIDLNFFQDIINQVNCGFDDTNDLIDALDTFLKDLQDLLDNIDNLEEKVTSRSYLTAIHNKFDKYINNYGVKLINNVPTLFHLAMLINSDNGFGIAGHSYHASQVKGAVTLYPTTFSDELLTPLYKKYVKVQNASTGAVVYEGIVDGKSVSLGTLATGKYNVTYDALDYYLVERTAYYSFEVK